MPKQIRFTITRYQLTGVSIDCDPDTDEILRVKTHVTRRRDDGSVHDGVTIEMVDELTAQQLNRLKQLLRDIIKKARNNDDVTE